MTTHLLESTPRQWWEAIMLRIEGGEEGESKELWESLCGITYPGHFLPDSMIPTLEPEFEFNVA